MLRPSVKLWLKKDETSIIGAGRVKLLLAVDEHGSIKKAAEAMNMSYRHAWGIIKHIRELVGEEIIIVRHGGRSGGGAELTELGKQIIKEFEDHSKQLQRLLAYGPRPALAVDCMIVDKNDNLILIRRKNPPFKGKLALPGGFVEYNETTEDAVRREVREELGIETKINNLVGVYSDPNRDPRQHTVSVVYSLEPLSEQFEAGDDAEAFERIPLKSITKALLDDLAFDHAEIIAEVFKLDIK